MTVANKNLPMYCITTAGKKRKRKRCRQITGPKFVVNEAPQFYTVLLGEEKTGREVREEGRAVDTPRHRRKTSHGVDVKQHEKYKCPGKKSMKDDGGFQFSVRQTYRRKYFDQWKICRRVDNVETSLDSGRFDDIFTGFSSRCTCVACTT